MPMNEIYINDKETLLNFDHGLKLKIQYDDRENIHWHLAGKPIGNENNEYIIKVDPKTYFYEVLMELFEDFRLGRVFSSDNNFSVNNSRLNQKSGVREMVKSIYCKKISEEIIEWYSDSNNDYLKIIFKDGEITIINQTDNLILKPDILFITNGNSIYGYGYLPFKRAFDKLNIKIKQKIKRI